MEKSALPVEENGRPIIMLTSLWTKVSGIWGSIRLPRNTQSGFSCVVQVGRYLCVVHGVGLHALRQLAVSVTLARQNWKGGYS